MRPILPLLVMLSAASAVASPPRLGVLVGASDTDDAAVAEAAARGPFAGFDVVPAAEMRRHVAAAASVGISCAASGDDDGCVAKIGASASLPFVLRVVVDAGRVRAALIDTGRGAAERVADASLVGASAGERATIVKAAVRDAVSKSGLDGFLDVNGPAGAQVLIDDGVRGPIPLSQARLAPGVHRVAVREEGFLPFSAEVQIKPALTTSVTVALTPSAAKTTTTTTTTPPPPTTTAPPTRPPFLTIAGAVVLGGGALGAAGLGVGAYVVTPDPARRDDYSAQEFNDATVLGQQLVIAAGVAGGVGALGALILVAGLVLE